MYMCGYPHMSKKNMIRELEFHVLVSSLIRGLGMELRFSGRASKAPNPPLLHSRLFCFIRTQVSLCSLGWPGTWYVDHMALNSQRSACVYFPSAGTKGTHHNIWPFYWRTPFSSGWCQKVSCRSFLSADIEGVYCHAWLIDFILVN